MKHLQTYEGFKKSYGQKVTPEEFKKIKKGSKILYMGDTYKVKDNDGYIIKIQNIDSKRIIGINLGQFNKGGMINEGVEYMVSDPEIQKAWSTVYNKSFSKEHPNFFKILTKRPPIDKRELNRLWEEMTEEKFETAHPEVFNFLFNKS